MATAPEKGLELLPLRFRSKLAVREPPTPTWPWLAGGFFGPLFLFVGLSGLEALLARARRETPRSRQQKAIQAARSRLRRAEQAAKAGEHRKAFGEIAETLVGLAGERIEQNLRGLPRAELRHALASRGAEETLLEELIQALDEADLARFSPGSDEARTFEALELAVELVARLSSWQPGVRS